MAQRKPLDAALRQTQDASLGIGAVAVADGPAPDFEALKSLLEQRLLGLPRFTEVLRTHSLDATAASWVAHPTFDITRQLRRVTLARPGDDTELFRAVAHALELPFDADRPPWECWIINGLKGSRWAILLKVHAHVAQGSSAAHLLARLCDDSNGTMFANYVGTEQDMPPQAEKSTWADMLVRASRVAAAVNTALAGPLWTAGRTCAPAVAPTRRRYSAVRVPIADVDRVCRSFGVTTNDVALAAITEGYRSVLLNRGEQPRADSVRTLVPGSMRSTGAAPSYLPVDHIDPVQRLRAVHHRRKATASGADDSARVVFSALNCLPTVVRGQAITLLTHLARRGVVTVATNGAGPRQQLRLLGRPLARLLPIPPTALQLSTGVAVLSYGDELVFGLTCEYDSPQDIKRTAAGIRRELARLAAISQDGVLLFSRDRRRRPRLKPDGSQRARASIAGRARR